MEHPFGIKHHQDMEKDSVLYNEVFLYDDCDPRLEKVGRKWKWTSRSYQNKFYLSIVPLNLVLV